MNFLRQLFSRLFSKKDRDATTSIKTIDFSGSPSPEPKMFERLRSDGNKYYFTNTVPYKVDGTLKPATIEKVFDFAYDMTFGGKGQHRDHRSGGKHERRNGEIFANTFQGKIAECAACNLFYKMDSSVFPDFSLYKLGTWDSADITVKEKAISVKSTKHFGQLLLLETKDWDEDAIYIPNRDSGSGLYDVVLFIRMNPNSEDILKSLKLFYSDTANYNNLKKSISEKEWTYNYVGYITRDDLQYIIRNRYIIPKGALLNGKMPMDAENYFVQSGDMRPVDSLNNVFN